jgi:hypothetical protein
MRTWIHKDERLHHFDWRHGREGWVLKVTTFLIDEEGRKVAEWWDADPIIAELKINRDYSTSNEHHFETEEEAKACAGDYEICLTLLQL